MVAFLLWYLVITLLGWAAFPILYRLLPELADRGYGFARPFGLLVWGFFFWLLASLHIFQNDLGGMVAALLLVFALSILAGWGKWKQMWTWIQQKTGLILAAEALFLAAFALWAVVRAANPDISGTEKPMELAFINAILRSPSFPPADPWLSGYAISYYYFGYVMVAMLIRVTGVDSGVGFNLALALWFGMTALAAFSILKTLLQRYFTQKLDITRASIQAGWSALLAPFFLLLIGNLEGFLEMLHARGIFWNQTTPVWTSPFWTWLNIQEINQPPALPLGWVPQRVAGIWWWRASRVLQDFDVSGGSREIIDEFPLFSYILGDLHPHVLAMPFALFAVAIALNLYLSNLVELKGEEIFSWFAAWARGGETHFQGTLISAWLRQPIFWLAALTMGGLAFLNTWDFPIYVALLSGVFVLRKYQLEGWRGRRIWEFAETGMLLGITGILLFLPFYLGFSSQAGGLLPSLSFFTRGIHFWIMFGVFLVPIFIWLISTLRQQGILNDLRRGLVFALVVGAALLGFSYLLGALGASLPGLGNALLTSNPASGMGESLKNLGSLFYSTQGGSLPGELLLGTIWRRISQPGTWLTLLGLLTLVWALLVSLRSHKPGAQEGETNSSEIGNSPNAFILILVLAGIALTLVPEFVYLRDQFGWRMNTIFKFYFQTWILWGLAAAFAVVVLWNELSRLKAVLFRLAVILLIGMALAYTIFGVNTRTNSFKPTLWTLNGNAYYERFNPDEMEAVNFLKSQSYGVLSEAIGGSYSQYARISMLTGLPTVLGWPGHESQWRGGAKEMGSRQTDIETLYRSTQWEEVQPILKEYHIRYVVFGGLERALRGSETKFDMHLKTIFKNNTVMIYEYIESATVASGGMNP